MYRIAHLSDLHLGYGTGKIYNTNGVNQREVDGYDAFNMVIDQVIEQEVDVVLLAGDTFHNPYPETRTILVAQEGFRRLSKAGIPCLILAGNHDASDIRAEIAANRILHDPARRIHSFIEPYVKVGIDLSNPRKPLVGKDGDVIFHLASHHRFDEQAGTMSQIASIDGSVNILSAHGSVEDPLTKLRLKTNQSPREIIIPSQLMGDFDWDYVLLGHFHTRGHVGGESSAVAGLGGRVYYNGSLVRRGFSDDEGDLGRGWTLWTVEDNGDMTPEFYSIEQRPQFDFDPLDASTMTAAEITDTIIANIKKARKAAGAWNLSPIARQQLENVSPVMSNRIRYDLIEDESKGFMTWILRTNSRMLEETLAENDNLDTTKLDSIDVVDYYDSWVDGSNTMAGLGGENEHLKEPVKNNSRDLVEKAQNDIYTTASGDDES